MPATGYQFTGWTGACTGTGACQLSGVTGVPSVGATFGLASAPAACASTTVLHAAPDGSGDGSSWAQAAALQQALALANGDADLGRCYEIRLRQGVYKPGPAGRPERHFAIDRPLQLKGGYTGIQSAAVNYVGTTEAQPITDRKGPSPSMDINHERRWIDPIGREWGYLDDRFDKIFTGISATGEYTDAEGPAAPPSPSARSTAPWAASRCVAKECRRAWGEA